MHDPGGSGASLEGPGMDRVRDLVAARVITFVLAQDRDRLARKPAYHYLLHREFEEYSCKMRSLNDRGDDSPEGELTDGILDQLAKFERGKNSREDAPGQAPEGPRGQGVGGSRLPYGFRRKETLREGPVQIRTGPRAASTLVQLLTAKFLKEDIVRLARDQMWRPWRCVQRGGI